MDALGSSSNYIICTRCGHTEWEANAWWDGLGQPLCAACGYFIKHVVKGVLRHGPPVGHVKKAGEDVPPGNE